MPQLLGSEGKGKKILVCPNSEEFRKRRKTRGARKKGKGGGEGPKEED